MSSGDVQHWLNIDPRTKLFLLFFANLIAFSKPVLEIQVPWVIILLVLITICGCWKAACKLALIYGALLLLQYVILPLSHPAIAATFVILVTYALKFFPCIIVGTFIVSRTTLREMITSLRRMHFPEALLIPLSVTIRYIPAIIEEIGYIRDAMKYREIHGFKKLECLVVPIMISATATAEELSAAAVTRGIESPKKKTSLVTLKFTILDLLCAVGCVAFYVIFVWM